MTEDIKFPTLENEDVRITIEDAQYIGLESITVASILAGKTKAEEYADVRHGGVAIKLALEYCRKLGEIKYRSSQPSDSKSDASNNFAPLEVETKRIEVDKEAWIDDFTIRITNYGPGMAHELLSVSRYLLASGLLDLSCQCIFDYLTFKDHRDFRKAFAFQFLFPPSFGSEEIENMENVLECILNLPTLDAIHAEFKDKIPFTPDELELAESENRLLRVGGKLDYKTNQRSIEELLIKVEYMVRRLSSFEFLSFWIQKTSSNCITEICVCLNEYFDEQSNIDIGKLCSTLCEPGSEFHLDFVGHYYHSDIAQKIENPSWSYEDVNAIEDDMDKIELEMAAEANLHKRKVEELCECCYTNWQNDRPHHKDKHKRKAVELCEGHYTNWKNADPHKDRVFPHLIYFLENRYQEIYCALCSLRRWMSPHEVQYNFNKLNACNKTTFEYAHDQNEDQDEDVESEEQNEDCYEDEGNEEKENEESNEDEGSEDLPSKESERDSQIKNGVVKSLWRVIGLARGACGEIGHTYRWFNKLQIEVRMLNHADLLVKDEEMLAFVCKEKYNLYMRACKRGTTSMISFAEDKEEIDRIKEETDKKFGDRGPVIESAKKKYFQYYRKFHYAMVDETKRQMELYSKHGSGSQDMTY